MPSVNDPALPVEAFDKEALVNRNPHPDFNLVESQRPDYATLSPFTTTKCPKPSWQPGDGANDGGWRDKHVVSIDPSEPGRPEVLNYKLMISATVPRPIALVSTITADGQTRNLAPFSYFQCVIADVCRISATVPTTSLNNVSDLSIQPPLYSLSFAGEESNDTLRNILETGECCISMTSEWLIE